MGRRLVPEGDSMDNKKRDYTDNLSHAKLHALTAREINKRLDEEARLWREQQQKDEEAR